MTDPQRFSRRSKGLAAELLRAGASERPNEQGMQQTLLALGLSGVVLSSTGVAAATAAASAPLTSAASASAAAGSVGLTTAGTVKAVSATLIIKWVGIGVLGGVGLAGVAVVASPMPNAVVPSAPRAPEVSPTPAAPARPQPRTAVAGSAAPSAVPPVAVPAASSALHAGAVEARAANPELDLGELLAAEVAYVDRARALLAASSSSQGLALLEAYERKFHEARLLPEVLFLQLEAYERSGRSTEARRIAQRLVDTFPNSPHVGRARKLLDQ